jgi:hypothetical protein
MRHIRHLHTEIARSEIPNFICTIEQNSKEPPKASESKLREDDGDDDDDGDTNDLIIDESAFQDDQEVIEVPAVINNRVNVIQSIGNPHKHQLQVPREHRIQEKPSQVREPKVTEIIDLSEKINTETEPQQQLKCDTEIQLPPKKKAIAKYDPIEHYRKILGLSTETKISPAQEQSDEQIFPDHWRKRTSQNFLFRRP